MMYLDIENTKIQLSGKQVEMQKININLGECMMSLLYMVNLVKIKLNLIQYISHIILQNTISIISICFKILISYLVKIILLRQTFCHNVVKFGSYGVTCYHFKEFDDFSDVWPTLVPSLTSLIFVVFNTESFMFLSW